MLKKIIYELDNAIDIVPEKHDASYILVPAVVRAYSKLQALNNLDYNDLDLLFLSTVGTWKHGIARKKSLIKNSHLKNEDKDFLINLLQELWERANKFEFSNREYHEKPSIGMFGTGFMTTRTKLKNDNSPSSIIKMCIEIIEMSSENLIFDIVDSVLKNGISGLAIPTLSQVLHCLKPTIFPILNGNQDMGNLFVSLGLNISAGSNKKNFIDDCRIIAKYRSENYPNLTNYRVFDLIMRKVSMKRTIDVHNYKEKFIEYCHNVVLNVTSSTPYDNFVKKIENGDFEKMVKKCVDVDFFNINSVSSLDYVLNLLKNNQEWVKYDKNFSRAPHAFLNTHYRKFLEIYFDKKTPQQPKNQILYGPPGTGKTYNTVVETMRIIKPELIQYYEDNLKEKEEDKKQKIEGKVVNYEFLKDEFDNLKKQGRIEFVTFHQSYSYEEFVVGIKPDLQDKNNLKYVKKKGVFKVLCDKAKSNEEPHVLIIDEINRGNISKIFGELITLIEEDKRLGEANEVTVKLPYAEEGEPAFGVPSNLYIIGTMNTSDRSIASVDIALRRRFKFKEMMPNENLIKEIANKEVWDILDNNNKKLYSVNLVELLKTLNKRITILLDRDHQIGHSYFLDLIKDQNGKIKENLTETELKEMWFSCIQPLLNEYFYGDWEKLKLVIPGFISSTKIPDYLKEACDEEYYYEFKTINEFEDNNEFRLALTLEKFNDKEKSSDGE